MIRRFIPIFFFSFIILIAGGVAFYLGFDNLSLNKTRLKASKGILDLTSVDFNKQKLVKLQGQAEFYWNKLMPPASFNLPEAPVPTGYILIPGIWNGFMIDGKPINGEGFATYHLKIKVNQDDWYGIKIKEFDCAYKLWVNGTDSVSAGMVGVTKNTTIPSWRRQEIYLRSQDKKIDLVIQIANFQHRKGGAEDTMIFGKRDKVAEYKQVKEGIELFLFGIMFIMFVYHFLFYLYRRKDKSVLWFSLFNLLILVRMLTTGEKVLLEIFPSIPWLFAVRLEYVSYTLAVPVFLAFIFCLYGQKVSKTVVRIVSLIAIAFSIFIVLTPSSIFTYTPIYYQGVVVASALYLFWVLSVAVVKRYENSTVLFFGYLFFLMAIINDLLYYNRLVDTSFIIPFGLFLMLFSQAYVLSRRLSKAFTDVERLSDELNYNNQNLEEIVKKRTEELLAQKERIENQRIELEEQTNELKLANARLVELDHFKENLTGMIVHDLKNPLNVILNLAKNEQVLLAGKQMHYLIQNILDIQKYEHKKMQLNLKQQSFKKLIEVAIDQVDLFLKERNIKVIVKFKSDLVFLFDRDVLLRVIINLLTNAIKFSPIDAEIFLSVGSEDNTANFSITNFGPSISDRNYDMIFLEYTQLDSRRLGVMDSQGLGLTFCKLAISEHQGTIGYESSDEKGTTFWFKIPLQNE